VWWLDAQHFFVDVDLLTLSALLESHLDLQFVLIVKQILAVQLGVVQQLGVIQQLGAVQR